MMLTRHDPRTDQLRLVEVLSDLRPSDLVAIAALTTSVRLREGERLCVQDRIGDQVFLVLSGQVGITRDGIPVAVVGAGALVGEMAVLERLPRSATAEALSDVSALVMSVREFTQLVSSHPTVAARIRALGETRRRELAQV